MTSLNQEENTEDSEGEEILEITGDDLDEPEGEEIAEITGDELNEPEGEEIVEITGDDLDESVGEEIVEITGDDLDESVGEEIVEITGIDLDESVGEENVEITGDELNEPEKEENAEITGDELDDPEGEENANITGNELYEPGDEEISELSGNELNELRDPEGKEISGRELKETKDKESKSYTEKNKFKGWTKKFRGKRTLSLIFVTGMCLLAMGSYYFSQNENGKEIISRVNIFPFPYDQSFIFESFIIPFQEKQGYTYISLTLSFELSNMELKKEIIEKKDQLRGIIYELLGQGIHTAEDARSLEKVKALILRRVNTILTSGEVSEAIITDFSLV
jgi:flagellar basal body-associated protein FliL